MNLLPGYEHHHSGDAEPSQRDCEAEDFRGHRDQRVSEVVRAELVFGCLKSDHPDKERIKVNHVLSPFEQLPFSGDAVEHYASIRADLERDGTMIGPNDLLVAATARAVGAVMVTANRAEFSRVPGLVVEDWTA